MKSIKKLIVTLTFLVLTFGSCLTAHAATNIDITTLKEGDILTGEVTFVTDINSFQDDSYFEFNNENTPIDVHLKIEDRTDPQHPYYCDTTLHKSSTGTNILTTLTFDKKYIISKLNSIKKNKAESGPDGRQSYTLEMTLEEYVPSESTAAESPHTHTHTHSFSWVETVEATETSDGLLEYRCSCGAVEERSVIPASMSFVKNIVFKIQNAPADSTVEINTNAYTCYTDFIMSALRKRTDVSLKTTFTDKDGVAKSFTIPAGQAPDDGELFYGFTYLGNRYGWN